MRRRARKLPFALAIAWLGCYGAPAAAQSLKVPFAALSPNYAPLWIADQAGLFKKHGLDVQLIYISAGSVIVPAILSGPGGYRQHELRAGPDRLGAGRGTERRRRDIESSAARHHDPQLDQKAGGTQR